MAQEYAPGGNIGCFGQRVGAIASDPLACNFTAESLCGAAAQEQDFRAALNEPTTRLSYAEAHFHLALVLVDLGRLDEAEVSLAAAVREPVFGPGVAGTRARIAAMRERWPEALAQLREARRLSPRELWVLLEFARVARKAEVWDQAEEALRWAILVHPEAPAPRIALVELYLSRGERLKARRVLEVSGPMEAMLVSGNFFSNPGRSKRA